MLWSDCPCCKQPFQSELGVELATEFLSFVETNFSDDQRMHITALWQKLLSLTQMVNLNMSTPQIRQEIKDIANKMLSMFEQVKVDKYMKPRVYNCLGFTVFKEGKNYEEALSHFEKWRDISISLGLTDEVAVAEKHVLFTKEKCGGERMSIEKRVELSQKLYNMRLKLLGEGALSALNAGLCLAKDLMRAHRLAEAEKLLLNLATVSKRVHGLDHSVTKKIHSEQKRLREQQSERLRAQRKRRLNLAVCFLIVTLASILSLESIMILLLWFAANYPFQIVASVFFFWVILMIV